MTLFVIISNFLSKTEKKRNIQYNVYLMITEYICEIVFCYSWKRILILEEEEEVVCEANACNRPCRVGQVNFYYFYVKLMV